MNDEQLSAYLWDPDAHVHPDVADVERELEPLRGSVPPLALPLEHQPESPPTMTTASLPAPPSSARPLIIGGAALLALAAGLVLWRSQSPEPHEAMAVVPVSDVQPELPPVPPPPPNAERLDPPPPPEPPLSTAVPAPVPKIPAAPEVEPEPATKPEPKPKPKPKPAPAADDSDQLDRLGQRDIMDGIAPIKADLKACGVEHDVPSGEKIALKFSVANTGKVRSVTVQGSYAEHPVADCLIEVGERAEFRPFDASGQGFTYKVKM